MSISFAVCTHNEGQYIQRLLDQLITHTKTSDSEIVILDDFSDDKETIDILNWVQDQPKVTFARRALAGNFADHKNYLNSLCKKDYIFQIDADELLHPHLLAHVELVIKMNPTVELFSVPRVNIVHGMTQDDIQRWGWVVNEKQWVMFPDYQTRIYRNVPNIIKWNKPVHERIVGHAMEAKLPAAEEWSMIHIKDIERQRKQNEFYMSI